MSVIHSLTMPKWGLSMKAGKVVGWLADEGAEVHAGTELLEIETDKMLSSLEAPASGILRRKVVNADDVVPVAGLLGVIADISTSDSDIDSFIADFHARARNQGAQSELPGLTPDVLPLRNGHLRYLKLGEGLPAAILVHGFGGDLNSWLFNHEELAGMRTVYALDLPGHGESSKQVGSEPPREFATVLEMFMDACGLSQAHLVGHSMGGTVALEFAFAHPGRCLSCVLIASAGLGLEIDGEYIEGFVTASRRKDLKPHLEKLFADSKLVGGHLIEDVLKYKRLDGVESALRTIADQFYPNGQQAIVFRDQLSQLPVPILVIWGAEDRIIPAVHSQDLPKNVQTAVLSGSGHMVHMEAAAKVNRLIQEFWESQRETEI